MVGVLILAGSLALQFLASVLAVRLVWVTRRAAWLFLASGILLMSIRRTITLSSALAGEQTIDSKAELVGLAISILMLVGIAFIAPFFREILSAGEKVKDSERQLQAILDNSESVVYVKDLDGHYVLVNKRFEEVFGLSRETVGDKSDFDFMPKAAAELCQQSDRELALQGNPRQFDEQVPSADGTVRDYMTVKFPLRGDDGKVHSLCGISTDITERLKAERAQRELEKNMLHGQKLESLGVMAGGIAHDFNNLLVPITGAIDLVEADLGDAAKPVAEDLEAMRSAATRAADLCRQLLAYSGQGHFRVESLSLSERIREFAPLLELSAQGSVLRFDLAQDLPATKADATQLQQIVLNLVVNAAEAATESSALITVTTGTAQATQEELESNYLAGSIPDAGDYVFLEVSDNGSGMDKLTVERLFEPFFTTKFTGRGLGLSAVLGIVRGHRGSIVVDSRPGEGTRIRVLLPVTDEPLAQIITKGSSGRSASVAATVLVVDDEKMIRSVALKVLERSGYSVLSASNGRQCVEQYSKHRDEIDVILLDMTMPEMNGKAALRALRKLDPEVRVVLSSGYDESAANSDGEFDGLAGFLQKPYTAQALLETIGEAVDADRERKNAQAASSR